MLIFCLVILPKAELKKELDSFLKFKFFHRSGGGIGITRLIRAMKLSNLLSV